jgi:hypothetical protein
VSALGSRQPSADVEELANTALGGQIPNYPGQKRPVRPGSRHYLGAVTDHLFRNMTVGRVVVFAAQPVRIHPGGVRHRGIKTRAWISASKTRHPRLRTVVVTMRRWDSVHVQLSLLPLTAPARVTMRGLLARSIGSLLSLPKGY